MALVRAVDNRMVTLQRQGRITFYGAATGQEAAVIGSGYALSPDDWVVPALREGGIALLRGFTLADYVNQVIGNGPDIQKGRQMPCHYGHRDVNYVTLSSCIANQLPHAVGIALAMRLKGHPHIAVGYMGDGATSEGDFHTSMEFAARLDAPTLFFCQNNQWAISTGVETQTIAKSMACKAHGYGMPGYRVDGNDVLAVWEATAHAVAEIRRTGKPAFIEALTYRVGAHSTSDDPSRYRDESITEQWKKRDPIDRYQKTLISLGHLSKNEAESIDLEYTDAVKMEIKRAETEPGPVLDDLFTDVYANIPKHLRRQQTLLEQSLRRT
jgi:pyruvate dehydrogenase E1 component alpha subunit/2-oxoisovalerate dehydrogenase E1 component alpha subunit